MPGFAYTAQRFDGEAVRGTVDAADVTDAERLLTAMGLRVLTLTPAGDLPRPVRLGAGDLQLFNEYLLQISRAGLPVERGLAVLSGELRSPALKRSIDALLADLRAGVPLEKAVAGHRAGFPPLYGRLLDAGIQSADLPGVLGRFGRHLQTVTDLRNGLWRACAYPLVVLLALFVLLSFLGYGVLPRYFALLDGVHVHEFDRVSIHRSEHRVSLPLMAYAILYLGRAAPFLLALAAIGFAGFGAAYAVLRREGRERGIVDRLTRVPLIGRPLRDSFVASWLDVATIGVTAGLDLPRALRLAGDAVALPSLRRDSDAMAARLEQGQPLGTAALALLPATVPMAIDIAQGPGQLPLALGAMAAEFQRQAERQISALPGRVMPALLVAVGLLAGGIMYSLWAPMIELFNALLSFS